MSWCSTTGEAEIGIGDWILTAGEATRRAAGTKKKFRILTKRGEPFWHEVFEGNPNIARPGEPYDEDLGFVNRHRIYIADETKEKRTFREYRPAPAPLRLNAAALDMARRAKGAVVFNPSIKRGASPNKDWGFERWQKLVWMGTDIRWIQIAEPGVRRVRGAEPIETPNFQCAMGLLKGARAAVLHEGALHHAAAALGTPAVVIFGSYISPRVTGYDGQAVLYVEDERHPLGCGMRIPCEHCAASMASITPAIVLNKLRELLACR